MTKVKTLAHRGGLAFSEPWALVSHPPLLFFLRKTKLSAPHLRFYDKDFTQDGINDFSAGNIVSE